MTYLFVSIYDRKTDRQIAIYYLADEELSRDLAIEKAWYRAICESKVGFDDPVESYRFELVYR